MKYRLRPIEVEALEMTAVVNLGDVQNICQVGDFLVRNPDGALRVVGPEEFFATYEPCDPGAVFLEAKPTRRQRKKKVVAELGPNGDAILRELK